MISIAHVLIALLGVVAGIIFGAIPGMTATMAVAVFLPMTYAYDLNMALYLPVSYTHLGMEKTEIPDMSPCT